jgi:N-acetylglutamate synthase-like GNAT family acetyltransferase
MQHSPYQQSRGEFTISTDPSLLDRLVIHNYLSNESYWAQHIPFETVDRAINNSLCFGLYVQEKQIGFARVISDYSTMAYLADVFILPEHRGKGLSKWMMEVILKHPDLQGLRKFFLGTRDAHGLYEQFGFRKVAKPENVMEIKIENPYQQNA